MKKLGALGALAGVVLTSGVAFADPPAVPATATALAQSIDLADAKGAGLTVISLLVAAGVALWGARLVLSKFMPRV